MLSRSASVSLAFSVHNEDHVTKMPSRKLSSILTKTKSKHSKDSKKVLKSGWVEKKSKHFGIWRKRFLILTKDHILQTFKDSKLLFNDPTETINLRNCKKIEKIVTQNKFIFEVYTISNIKYEFVVLSLKILNEWVHIISKIINILYFENLNIVSSDQLKRAFRQHKKLYGYNYDPIKMKLVLKSIYQDDIKTHEKQLKTYKNDIKKAKQKYKSEFKRHKKMKNNMNDIKCYQPIQFLQYEKSKNKNKHKNSDENGLLEPNDIDHIFTTIRDELDCKDDFESDEEANNETLQDIDEDFDGVSYDKLSCGICYDLTPNYIIIPCGHQGICADCKNEILSRGECPFCNTKIENIYKCYSVMQS